MSVWWKKMSKSEETRTRLYTSYNGWQRGANGQHTKTSVVDRRNCKGKGETLYHYSG